jgi:hypothetical protein
MQETAKLLAADTLQKSVCVLFHNQPAITPRRRTPKAISPRIGWLLLCLGGFLQQQLKEKCFTGEDSAFRPPQKHR